MTRGGGGFGCRSVGRPWGYDDLPGGSRLGWDNEWVTHMTRTTKGRDMYDKNRRRRLG
jgi:hypothetical protein